MHLVIGATGYPGRYVIAALGEMFPVRGVEPGPELDLAAALEGVDVVHMAAELHAPTARLNAAGPPEPFLLDLLRLAPAAGVRRIVHLSTAQVLGPAPRNMLLETAPVRPDHAYEKLHARDERLLLLQHDVEVVVLRPAVGLGLGEPVVERLMGGLLAGRPLLVGRGRAPRTFLAGPDLGRAFVAAALRGRSGHTYLLGGFQSCWRDVIKSVAEGLRLPARIVEVPYDLAYLTATVRQWRTPPGQECWPNPYIVDLLGRSHLLEDGLSRRDLSWSPLVGSLAEAVGDVVEWVRSWQPLPRSSTRITRGEETGGGSPGQDSAG